MQFCEVNKVVAVTGKAFSRKPEDFLNRNASLCGIKSRWDVVMKNKCQPIRRMRFYAMEFTEIEDEIVAG